MPELPEIQAHTERLLAALGGQPLLYLHDGGRVVLGRRAVARADHVDGEEAAREVCADGLLDPAPLFERQALLGQHAVAALAEFVAHALALGREVCGRLGEVDEPCRGRAADRPGGRRGDG